MPPRDPYSTGPITNVHPGQGSPTPSPDPEPAGVDPQQRDPIRRAVAARLAVAGRRHTRHRTDRAARPERPGPHAVVFLFAEPAPTAPADHSPNAATNAAEVVTLASRMFLDGPDVADLPTVLAALTERIGDYADLSLPTLIGHVADRVEPLHGPTRRYLGVAVSSIDLNREGGEQADPMPWDGLAHLIDGTRMALHATRPEEPPHIVSTHTLDTNAPIFSNRTWAWATSPTPTGPLRRDELTSAHTALANLHHLLTNISWR